MVLYWNYMGLFCEDVYCYYPSRRGVGSKVHLLLVLEVEQVHLVGVLWTRCHEGVELALVVELWLYGKVTAFDPVIDVLHPDAHGVILRHLLDPLIKTLSTFLESLVHFLYHLILCWHKLKLIYTNEGENLPATLSLVTGNT